MNKKMCFLIFVAAVIALIAGIVFKIGVINNLRDAFLVYAYLTALIRFMI